MTLRTIFSSRGAGRFTLPDMHNAALLPIVISPIDPVQILSIPAALTARYQSSVRNISGSTESQNSATTNFAHGYVKEQGVAVARSVGVYRRDTKELLASTTSGPNGFFWVSWVGYSGKVTITIFEEDGSGYNGKILDLVVSN